MQTQTYITNYTFNQDGTCFACATSTGFRTFSLWPQPGEISRRQVDESASAVGLATMLFQTNYVALVLKSQPYKVLLWDDSLRQKPHEIWSRYEILNVLLRRDVLVVISEYRIYVYAFGSFQVLLHIETASNPRGLAALCPGAHQTGGSWVLACPASGSSTGTVKLQMGVDQSAEIANAHNHSLAAIALNADGSLLATASEQGTVIKVFSTRELVQLFSFRRGTYAGLISSLAFRLSDSRFLAVASGSSPTVHVFHLVAAGGQDDSEGGELSSDQTRQQPAATGMSAVATIAAKAAKAAVAAAVTAPNYFAATRSYCQFRIPDVDNHGKPLLDLRLQPPGGSTGSSAPSGIPIGPIVSFGKNGNIFVLHYNGVLYETDVPEGEGLPAVGEGGAVELGFKKAHVVFAARPDFRIEQGKAQEEEGAWQLL